MRGKKLRKQLMAIGIERNDAAGFIRAYRVIQRAKKQELCRDIMYRPMSVGLSFGRPVNLETLRAQYILPDEVLYGADRDRRKQVWDFCKDRLVEGMARELIDKAAVIVQQECRTKGCIVFRAEIQVAMPEKGVRHG